MTAFRVAGLASVVWLLTVAGPGSAYQLDRGVFSNAAFLTVGGSHSLRGTLAEAGAVGSAAGGGYSLVAGFWAPSVLAATGVGPVGGGILAIDRLDPAFPNPFRREATIAFSLAAPAHVTVRVYDVAGRRVATLADGYRLAGAHRLLWDGRDDAGLPLASGVYFYRLETGSWRGTGRMLKVH